VTKTQDATETVTVSMDYNTWLQEYKEHGSCTYQGDGGRLRLLLLLLLLGLMMGCQGTALLGWQHRMWAHGPASRQRPGGASSLACIAAYPAVALNPVAWALTAPVYLRPSRLLRNSAAQRACCCCCCCCMQCW
jgi:hypothetical protein